MMTAIKVGIVEDEMIIAEGIAEALRHYGYVPTIPATSFTEAMEMIAAESPDILLLDIQLSGKKDGIDLAARIKEEYNIPFIFLTGNSDAATVQRAKQLCPPAYLVKPFNKEELYTSIEVCLHNFSVAQQQPEDEPHDNFIIKDSLFIKQGQSFQKVGIKDILYLESDNVYINVYLRNNKMLVRSTLQNYLELLHSDHFFRVHRSFAVNIHHVDTISADSVFVNGREIPIGKSYRDELLAILRLG